MLIKNPFMVTICDASPSHFRTAPGGTLHTLAEKERDLAAKSALCSSNSLTLVQRFTEAAGGCLIFSHAVLSPREQAKPRDERRATSAPSRLDISANRATIMHASTLSLWHD